MTVLCNVTDAAGREAGRSFQEYGPFENEFVQGDATSPRGLTCSRLRRRSRGCRGSLWPPMKSYGLIAAVPILISSHWSTAFQRSSPLSKATTGRIPKAKLKLEAPKAYAPQREFWGLSPPQHTVLFPPPTQALCIPPPFCDASTVPNLHLAPPAERRTACTALSID